MAQVKVDSSDLRRAAQKFQQDRATVERLMREMMDLVTGRTPRYWKGQASERYRNQCRKLEDEMRFIRNKIQEHADDLRNIADIYDGAENRNADASSRLTTDF